MKELASVYLALLLITIAGCSTTRTYSPYDPEDRAALAHKKGVKIELADGSVYYGTNLHFGADWLSFEVASDRGWPPPEDFYGYDMGVPLESIMGLSNTAAETNKRNARIALAAVGLTALIVAVAVALDQFCEGRDSPDHPVCH